MNIDMWVDSQPLPRLFPQVAPFITRLQGRKIVPAAAGDNFREMRAPTRVTGDVIAQVK